jgi:hypothetical protein
MVQPIIQILNFNFEMVIFFTAIKNLTFPKALHSLESKECDSF